MRLQGTGPAEFEQQESSGEPGPTPHEELLLQAELQLQQQQPQPPDDGREAALQEQRRLLAKQLQEKHLVAFQQQLLHIKHQQQEQQLLQQRPMHHADKCAQQEEGAQHGEAAGKRKAEEELAESALPKRRCVSSKMCDLFMMGGCTRGDACPDAHADKELIKFPQLAKQPRPCAAEVEAQEELQEYTAEDYAFEDYGPEAYGMEQDWSGELVGNGGCQGWGDGGGEQGMGFPPLDGGCYGSETWEEDGPGPGPAVPTPPAPVAPSGPRLIAPSPNVVVPSFKPMGQRTMYAYKLVLCKFHLQGRCMKGSSCTFAHGDQEDLAAQAVDGDGQPAYGFKSILCRFHLQGRCNKGASCTFAHGDYELGGVRGGMPEGLALAMDNIPKGVVARTLAQQAQLGSQPQVDHWENEEWGDDHTAYPAAEVKPYKSMLCKFHLKGRCLNGASCAFAHGEHELGQPSGERAESAAALLAEQEAGAWGMDAATAAMMQSAAMSELYQQMALQYLALPPTEQAAQAEAAGEYQPGAEYPPEYQAGQEYQLGAEYQPGAEELSACDSLAAYEPQAGAELEAGEEGDGQGPDPGAATFSANAAAAWAQALHSAGLLQSTAAALQSAAPAGGPGTAAIAAAAAAAAEYRQTLLLAQAQSQSAAGAAQILAQAQATESAQAAARPSYKTQMCKFFPTGKCFKGALCTYAHGDEDLRPYIRGGVPSGRGPGGVEL